MMKNYKRGDLSRRSKTAVFRPRMKSGFRPKGAGQREPRALARGAPLTPVMMGALAIVFFFGCMSYAQDRAQVVKAQAQKKSEEMVIKITAKQYEYSPNVIRIKRGVPVILEFTSLDRLHGFKCPKLGLRADIKPGKISSVLFVPQKTGVFEFHCDIFCGEGHDNMSGKIIVYQ